MTDAPNIVDFTAHPGDYTGVKSSWWIQEDYSESTQFLAGSHQTHVYAPGGAIERVIGSVITSSDDEGFLALVSACDSSIDDPGPAWQQSWSTEQADFDVHAGDGYWPAGVRYAPNLFIAWQREGEDLAATETTRVWWGNLCVVHRRYDYASGLVDTTADASLDVEGLVHDLMGRGLNSLVEFDPVRVAPGTSWSTVLDQAAWWDGVSAREVLAYATTHAPLMWWAVWEPGLSGLPRFEVGRWDGIARYVLAPGIAQVELSGGATGLANRALVRFVGTMTGQSKQTWVAEVTADVRALAASGLVRTMVVDLTGEGLMPLSDAAARGVAALAQAALAKTAGRAVVAQPIWDRVEGRMVDPWEIRAGSPVIVSDAPLSFGRSTSLAESIGADGVSVFRCRSVEYDAGRNEATLALDGGSRSLVTRLRGDTVQRRYDAGDPTL
jgi:hypothetical protein